jgi:hypothetical protein
VKPKKKEKAPETSQKEDEDRLVELGQEAKGNHWR